MLVAEPWATNAAGRAGPLYTALQEESTNEQQRGIGLSDRQDHFRLGPRHDDRVVRLLHLRQPGRGDVAAHVPEGSAGVGADPDLGALRDGIRCPPVRRDRLRPRRDLIGRKYAFLVTLTIMGLSTFVIGLLPTYASVGLLAPSILLLLRLLQGLALGGEYGGAAVYVAEHVPDNKRGYYTSFIQVTATLGLFVSLGVILGVKKMMSDADFKAWGWRLPLLISIVLVGISLWIRMTLKESPLFASITAQGKSSIAPLRESFV